MLHLKNAKLNFICHAATQNSNTLSCVLLELRCSNKRPGVIRGMNNTPLLQAVPKTSWPLICFPVFVGKKKNKQKGREIFTLTEYSKEIILKGQKEDKFDGYKVVRFLLS